MNSRIKRIAGCLVYSLVKGKTWKVHTRFEKDCSNLDMGANRKGEVVLQVGYKVNSFRLFLVGNGKDRLVTDQAAI